MNSSMKLLTELKLWMRLLMEIAMVILLIGIM